MSKVLIVGCGELGSRFLQAVAQIPTVTELEIVEPSEQAQRTGEKRLAEVPRSPKLGRVQWLSGIDELRSAGDVAIIATHADGRPALFKRVLELGYKRVLTEKVVTQSVREYRAMLADANAHGASVWVNCKIRTHPVWQHIKRHVGAGEPVDFSTVGGNHGLCTNGVHATDLFVFLSDSPVLRDRASTFEPQLLKTKRGKYDLAGALLADGSNGSRFSALYSDTSMAMPVDIVVTPRYRWVVDHITNNALEGSAETGWKLELREFEGDLRVSAMAVTFVTDILTSNTCQLPTLAECAVAHEFVLTTTLPAFNRLLGKNDDVCPIT